jgi:hypothetical protein
MGKITLPFRSSFRFWPALLCAAVFATPCLAQAPITNGLVARWTGDGNAKDSAGHFDGEVSGGLRYVPGPSAGQAFQFNGGEAKVDFGNSIGNFGTRDFTVAFWMKTDSKIPLEAFLDKKPTCDGRYSHWTITSGGGEPRVAGILVFAICKGVNTTSDCLLSSRPVNDGQWHHIAWVRQSTSSGSITGLAYLDGALDNSKSYPEVVDVANQSPLLLGRDTCECCDGRRAYSGAAAELQLFSHALTAEEILAIYKAGKPDK